MLGATLGLIPLVWLNRDILPSIEYRKLLPSMERTTPTPLPTFESDFMDTCMEHSKGNRAYCICSINLVRQVDPEWNDGTGKKVYEAVKQYTAVSCMIES